MKRRSVMMHIPYPFPQPSIIDRARYAIGRWHVGFILSPWPTLKCAALVTLALLPLSFIVWSALH